MIRTKAPARRADLQGMHRERTSPISHLLRRVADTVLHDRQPPSKPKQRDIGLGIKHGAKRRFTEDEVLAFRKRWKEGESAAAIAKSIGANKDGMYHILNGTNYSWVKDIA